MTPRQRRLNSDYAELNELARLLPLTFLTHGDPPDRYEVICRTDGLERDNEGRVRIRSEHRFAVYMPLDYPRRPPLVVWQTPVFHPNLLSPTRNGAVCLGSWSAAESLSDLCRRLVDIVSYRSFNLEDALDKEAVAWVRDHDLAAGADLGEALLAS
jgi:ubiquitin-protein ligase